MAEQSHSTLEPPPRTSIDDPGAHELESSDSDDHFSDAQSDLKHSGGASPIVPITRIEKVDNDPSYGEVPGTEAYKMRDNDAEPDQIAVVGDVSNPKVLESDDRPTTPGGQPIPITVVERVDDSPSYGEVPATEAYEKRQADAVPDLVVKTGDRSRSTSTSTRSRAESTPGDLPIPITKVEKVDSKPSHGEVPGTEAYEMRKGDAQPDVVEEVGDAPGEKDQVSSTSERLTESASPTSPAIRSQRMSHARRKSSAAGKKGAPINDYNEDEDGSDGGFGDDFDDFEEGEEDAEFGDFDGGFQEAEAAPQPVPVQSLPAKPAFSVLDFDEFDTAGEIIAATEPYMDALFPPDTIDKSVLPPLTAENPIFLTPRSASLWSQLVAPPPLQPPDWIRSRIRRLFLVSLGVPVDLDEILPASKQKKLILPSINLNNSPRNSTDSRSISRLKNEGNMSTTSLDSQGKARSDSRRRKGPPPAPQLDLVSARQLCTITDEALNGFTDEELKEHIKKLQTMEETAKEVLEYWTKRTDKQLGDREAFEGVIENLVKHARKTRK